jgi:NAD(P)-dependent dehydrogenase (short-subunit alcohol dehydrogenase family)
MGGYSASKAALNSLTRKIHFENEWLVAFPLNPGPVATDMGEFLTQFVFVFGELTSSRAPYDSTFYREPCGATRYIRNSQGDFQARGTAVSRSGECQVGGNNRQFDEGR